MLNSSAYKLGTETAFGVLARAGVLADQGRYHQFGNWAARFQNT